ncbi:MAG: ABC-type transport auxiliary lipoprotein family protein, partial [Caulobacteraceae bacterium]
QAASTDRILTITGAETAYIAGARWVAPAPTLFDEALDNAFGANPNAPRLTSVGAATKAAAVLRLDVTAFEAVYDQGQEAAPEVVVRVRASLNRAHDRALLGERTFEARRRAADNRVGAIVPAFDAATAQVLTDLAAWTGGFAGAARD